MALQFTAQGGDHQADGLCRTCGVRDDVFCRRSGGAQIFAARPVHQRLGAGISMDGGHGAHGDAEGILEDFGHRRQAVGGAGGHGDDGVIRGQGVIVDVVDDGFHLASGGGNQHFARAGLEMGLRFLGRGVESGTLHNHLGACRLPWNMLRLFFGIHRNGFAVDDQRIFCKVDAPREGAVV